MTPRNFKPPITFSPSRPKPQPKFQDLEASTLFCPRCQKAVPVRKHLLLVLPEGEKYDYICTICSTPVGAKIEKENNLRI